MLVLCINPFQSTLHQGDIYCYKGVQKLYTVTCSYFHKQLNFRFMESLCKAETGQQSWFPSQRVSLKFELASEVRVSGTLVVVVVEQKPLSQAPRFDLRRTEHVIITTEHNENILREIWEKKHTSITRGLNCYREQSVRILSEWRMPNQKIL